MKIFGIGLSRTGTTTLHSILSQYGYRSIHFVPELIDGPNWDVVDKYDALCDSPIPMLYKECDERFPGSKFILTTRSLDSWLSSMKWMFSDGKSIFDWSEREPRYHQKFYGTKTFNKKTLEHHWQHFHRDVAGYFSNRHSDLLVLNIEEGFNLHQLCEFLEIPFREVTVEKLNVRRKSPLYQKVRYYFLKEFGK